MSIKYTKDETLQEIKNAAKNMNKFYAQRIVNWYGKSRGESEYYSEIIAQWLVKNLNLLQGISISKISRTNSYFLGHNADSINNKSNRIEEKIAMAIFLQKSMPGIGCILDYQVPLKDKQQDSAGKIDLLSYDEKTATFRILELKRPRNKQETLLRCVLEAYTYLQILDSDKLTQDAKSFYTDISISTNARFKACVLFFSGSLQYTEYEEMKAGNRPHLKELIQRLDIELILISQTYSANILHY